MNYIEITGYAARPFTQEEVNQYLAQGYFETDYYDDGYLQLVKPVSPTKFSIIDNACTDQVVPIDIDIKDYTVEDLERYAKYGYESLEYLYQNYKVEEANQILAEIIVESSCLC